MGKHSVFCVVMVEIFSLSESLSLSLGYLISPAYIRQVVQGKVIVFNDGELSTSFSSK